MLVRACRIRFALISVIVLLIGANAAAQSNADARAAAILQRMTTEEKIDYIGGVDGFFIRGVPRLGVPRLKMADGPIGVRNFGPATTMAAGISLAATWDPALAEQVGTQIGRDARTKGVHFLLGPGVNIYTAPMNGRNFEYFGEDPFLASRIAVGYIRGVQSQGVSATVKHFMGNNSEYDRHNVDDIIDERALREIYLPVFEAAVKEGHVGAIMDSYNLVNGAHLTQNGYLNNEVAKKEWGFRGIVMSDWTATYDAVAAANGGLDLEMPSGKFMNRANLLPALQQGKVTIATVDDKVQRILRTAIEFGWWDREQMDLSIPRYNLDGRKTALEAAREGMVLLKNDGIVLPLRRDAVKSIAIIGPGSDPAVPVGGGSARVQPFAAVSFLRGLVEKIGDHATVYYARGIPSRAEIADATEFFTTASRGDSGVRLDIFANPDLAGAPAVTRFSAHVNDNPGFDGATLDAPSKGYSARWTGYYVPSVSGNHDFFVEGPGEGGGFRMYVDGKLVIDDWRESRELTAQVRLPLTAAPHKIVLEQYRTWKLERTRIRLGIARESTLVDPGALALASRADAVVIAVGYDPETESEGADRTFALPTGQDELIRAIAAANKKSIVVITSGGSVDMHGWIENVPALIQAWYPGQEGGTALAEILLGDVNPSGRLPVSFESRWEDNPTHDSYYPESGTRRVIYRTGIFVGYRGYEHNRVKPLFPFGYGLSYTKFKYGNLAIAPAAAGSGSLYEVSFDVTNTGAIAGADVAQLYIGSQDARVPRPDRELKGFARISLRAGETRRVTIPLDARAFCYYDTAAKHWRADAGRYGVIVGRSVEQSELSGAIDLPRALTAD